MSGSGAGGLPVVCECLKISLFSTAAVCLCEAQTAAAQQHVKDAPLSTASMSGRCSLAAVTAELPCHSPETHTHAHHHTNQHAQNHRLSCSSCCVQKTSSSGHSTLGMRQLHLHSYWPTHRVRPCCVVLCSKLARVASQQKSQTETHSSVGFMQVQMCLTLLSACTLMSCVMCCCRHLSSRTPCHNLVTTLTAAGVCGDETERQQQLQELLAAYPSNSSSSCNISSHQADASHSPQQEHQQQEHQQPSPFPEGSPESNLYR